MAVIFDLDGTLINTTYLNVKLIKEGYEKLGIKLSTNFVKQIVKFPYTTIAKLIYEKTNIKITNKDIEKVHIYKLEHMEENLNKVTAFKGAEKTIDFLKSKQVKIGIFTSASKKEVELYKRKVKFLNKFDVIVSSTMKREKPDPYFLIKTLSLLKASKNKSVYIGDAAVDEMAAKRAGIKFIGVFNKDLHPYFKSYKDLLNYFKKNYEMFKE
ncbi:MAG: HAD-IA family hydrolase [Candidatus Rehaiarchaeum fermentans]|nr:HAD family hydrolase [Candidatus Rehaiarchaeum fermentans]